MFIILIHYFSCFAFDISFMAKLDITLGLLNVSHASKQHPSSLFLLLFSPSSYCAALTLFHGRLFFYGDGSDVELLRIEGVATLGLGGADGYFHFFDCNSTTGSNDIKNLMWEKDNGPLRFKIETFDRWKRLDLSKPTEGGKLDYSDEGVYTCRDVVTMESISLNISGGKWLGYPRSDNECVISKWCSHYD